MKIVYMGTPDFAVAPLEAMIKEGYEITAVVTQPDRPKGRGKDLAFSPVKECAVKNGIPVFQPLKIRMAEEVEILKKYEADIFVVAAFGQILSEEILNMPKYGCINIHASLLPKYRGAAPIQWAVLNGDEKSGVTIQQMAKGVDTGDILAVKEVKLDSKETGDSLFDKLMKAGAELLVETLPKIEKGEVIPIPQKEEEATHVGKLTKEMGKLDFSLSATDLERKVRGLNSWPGTFTCYNGKSLKVWEADVCNKALFMDRFPSFSEKEYEACAPGTVMKTSKDTLFVKTGEGVLLISSIQAEGKKRMSVHDYLLGAKIPEGIILGE